MYTLGLPCLERLRAGGGVSSLLGRGVLGLGVVTIAGFAGRPVLLKGWYRGEGRKSAPTPALEEDGTGGWDVERPRESTL